MELITVPNNKPLLITHISSGEVIELKTIKAGTNNQKVTVNNTSTSKPFIEANTIEASFEEIKDSHIIPIFIKDNEPVISHTEFIESMVTEVTQVYQGENILKPSIRLSHPIKGRIPEARRKDTDEHFKIFIGFKNSVCTNLCIWTDGLQSDLKVQNANQLRACIKSLIERFNPVYQIRQSAALVDYSLTEQQFAHIIGKCRMYNYLPHDKRKNIPTLSLGDAQINQVCK